MALEKTTKKYKRKKKLSTDALTHAYTYRRQIIMLADDETNCSDLRKASRSVSTSKQGDISIKDVLMWEAT